MLIIRVLAEIQMRFDKEMFCRVFLFASLATAIAAIPNDGNVTTTVLVTGNSSAAAVCVTVSNTRHDCGNLQSALDFVAHAPNKQNCTVVQVPSGVHTLKQNVTISKNVIIRGSRGTKVTFKFSSDLLQSIDQIAVLSLKNCHQVSIENIVFEDSPGYIEIVNVTEISILDSSFR